MTHLSDKATLEVDPEEFFDKTRDTVFLTDPTNPDIIYKVEKDKILVEPYDFEPLKFRVEE